MAGEGWQSLIDLAELAVNAHLTPAQEQMPYELATAREPRLSFDVNLEGVQAEQGIKPTERLDNWARIRNLAARHQISLLPSYHEPPTVAVLPLQTPRPHTLRQRTRIVFQPGARRDEPRELPRPRDDYRRGPPPFLCDPTRGLVYKHVARKPRFYIMLAGSVVQLWILRRIVMLRVPPA